LLTASVTRSASSSSMPAINRELRRDPSRECSEKWRKERFRESAIKAERRMGMTNTWERASRAGVAAAHLADTIVSHNLITRLLTHWWHARGKRRKNIYLGGVGLACGPPIVADRSTWREGGKRVSSAQRPILCAALLGGEMAANVLACCSDLRGPLINALQILRCRVTGG